MRPKAALWSWPGHAEKAVRTAKDWDRPRIDAALAHRGLRVEEPLDEIPGGYFARTADDPIEAARALVEEDGVVYAEPDFIRRMRLRTRAHSVDPRAGTRRS